MPTIEDLYRELTAQSSIESEPVPSEAEQGQLMDEAAAGMDLFLAGHRHEEAARVAEADLEALFMQGSEARAAAEVQSMQGPSGLPILTPPPEDFRQEDQIQFDANMDDVHRPNPAVRWTVGRENAPPAAPPMRQGSSRNDGRVVSSLQGGRFVPQVTRVTHQVTTSSPSTPAPVPVPDTTRPALPPTLYDHLLED